MKPHFRDSSVPIHLHVKIKTPDARKINSAYEAIFEQLVQGNHLTVPCAYVNLASMRTQFNRWRNKWPDSLGLKLRCIDSYAAPEDVGKSHMVIFLRLKQVKSITIPYTLGNQEIILDAESPNVPGNLDRNKI